MNSKAIEAKNKNSHNFFSKMVYFLKKEIYICTAKRIYYYSIYRM